MRPLIIAGAIAISCASAQAQFSAELGYTGTTLKSTDEEGLLKASPAAIRGIMGYELHPNLAVEGMLAIGVGGASLKDNGTRVPGFKVRIDRALGAYIKPKMQLNKSIDLFARLGFAESKLRSTFEGESGSSKDSSASYGAGLSYAVDPKYSVNADYMRYLNKDGTKVDGWTLGVGFKF